MNLSGIFLWGVVATILLTTIEAFARGLGLSRMSIPFIVGSAFTQNRARADLVGSLVHLVNGILLSFFYAAIFEALHEASWWLGSIIGFFHGLFILAVLMPLLPSFHPRMASEAHGPTPTRMLQPAGFMALNYGKRTAIVAVIAHILYGAVLGAFYVPVHSLS